MSDLKEFGQNFLLSAGTQLAKNIQEAGERDRKDILDATKELKGTIARNKAADAKITSDLKSKLTTLRTALPGGNLDFYKTAMSSDANFNRVMKAVDDDVNKTGSWFRDSASEFGISDPSSIYKALDEGGKKIKLSDIRTRTTTGPSKADLERDDSEDWKRTILGMRLDPNQVMTKVYKKISMGGRNAIGPDDLQYAYGVPTRGIDNSGLPLNIRKTQKSLSILQSSAIADLNRDGEPILFAPLEQQKQLLKLEKELKTIVAGIANETDIGAYTKDDERKKQNEIIALRQAIISSQQNKFQTIIDKIARNSYQEAVIIINNLDISKREKDLAKKLILKYQNKLSKYSPKKGIIDKNIEEAIGTIPPPYRNIMGVGLPPAPPLVATRRSGG